MGVLLQVCCMSLEQLFKETPTRATPAFIDNVKSHWDIQLRLFYKTSSKKSIKNVRKNLSYLSVLSSIIVHISEQLKKSVKYLLYNDPRWSFISKIIIIIIIVIIVTLFFIVYFKTLDQKHSWIHTGGFPHSLSIYRV